MSRRDILSERSERDADGVTVGNPIVASSSTSATRMGATIPSEDLVTYNELLELRVTAFACHG